METIRVHATAPERNVCKESCLALAYDSKHSTATERSLGAEVAASFELTDAVADLLGLPRTTSVTDLAKALREKHLTLAPRGETRDI